MFLKSDLLCFLKKLLLITKPAFFIQFWYDLKQLFSLWTQVIPVISKMIFFASVTWSFSNHSNIRICCLKKTCITISIIILIMLKTAE